jgi:hypothetical protein
MTRLEDLVDRLVESFAEPEVARTAPLRVAVTALDLDVPIETRFAEDGVVLATLPRGVLATGFETPVGRLRVHCREIVA